MEIVTEDYSVIYTESDKKIVFKGTMRLQNLQAYAPIKKMMKDVYTQIDSRLTLDFSELSFLNSSGITNFSMFVLECKKGSSNLPLHVVGSNKIGWQDKSLNNFKKLWNEISVEIVD